MGFRDNLVFYNGEASNYVVKIILATILFIVAAATATTRWRNPDLFFKPSKVLYVAAYFASFGIAIVLSFLGGVIIYGF